MKIEQEQLGISYDLPDTLYQRDVEAFYAAQREIKAGIARISPEEFSKAAANFITAMKDSGVKPGSDGFTPIFREFTQGLYASQAPRSELSGPERNGVIIRTAIRCEWIGGDEDAVGDMHPAAAVWLANEIAGTVSAAFDIPGE